MGLLGKIFGSLLGGVFGGTIVKAILKKPKPISPPPIATRDDATAQAARDIELARRRGAASDILSGSGGEPSAGSIGRLVIGS